MRAVYDMGSVDHSDLAAQVDEIGEQIDGMEAALDRIKRGLKS